ncbi:YqaE/Pmp3 family membrane protein [Aliidiomarina indica]|uniref:YqaE/Pmp3 family membrane protein n=1 Tax=Aliidiomarina indica TaxID=2749147 RepID=UPI0018901BDA|nr:YqaE/Pmp3 family membrane protein [Aliidiomarina indica]
MNYLLALVLPPVAVWMSGARKQMWLSLAIYLASLLLFRVATGGETPGAYAAAPVLYVVAIIHAFVLTHRHYQQAEGQVHPHRGSATQSKPPKDETK